MNTIPKILPKKSNDNKAYHDFLIDNADKFKTDNNMKSADEYVAEFMDKLKTNKLKI